MTDAYDDERRLQDIIKRAPDPDAFISELENYADEQGWYEEIAVHPLRLILSYVILAVCLALTAKVVITKYNTYRPVSLKHAIQLHENSELTTKIFHKFMYAKPRGKAIKPLITLADQGNPDAQNMVCWAYMAGLNVDKNPKLAERYCLKSAAQGSYAAKANLGAFYSKSTEYQDFDKAIHYYTEAAPHRARAARGLSVIYELAPPPWQDYKKAISYKLMAAEQGDAQMMLNIAAHYENATLGVQQDTRLAIEYYKKALKAGHIDAEPRLASLYEYAEAPYQDYNKVIYHAKRAILRSKHPMALGIMGDVYLKGLGVEKNIEAATKYYKLASHYGYEYATGRLAYIETLNAGIQYEFIYKGHALPYSVKDSVSHPEHIGHVIDIINEGNIGELTVSKIFQYYGDSITNDFAEGSLAPNLIGEFYPYAGYKSEFEPLVKAYENAVLMGSARHAYELGLIYMSGSGVLRNPELSLKWISKAMDMGYPDVRSYVGLYYSGPDNPVEVETKHARDLLYQAANTGSAEAAKTLAKIYKKGLGVKVDKVLAMYWLAHADKGRVSQGEALYALRQTMTKDQLSYADRLIETCKKSEIKSCI